MMLDKQQTRTLGRTSVGPLEVSARGPDSVRFSVQVAEEPMHG
mgnify:CR=1 FL=1